MTHSTRSMWVVVFAAGLGACSSTLGPKSARLDGMTSEEYRAAFEIAAARCDRQTSACSQYPSRDACIADKLDVSVVDTRLPRCSNQVDTAQVQACVTEISQGRCGTGIAQLAACKNSELCPYESQEGTF